MRAKVRICCKWKYAGTIERYLKDREFCISHSPKGIKSRNEYMLYSEARFAETLEEFERRIGGKVVVNNRR